MREMRTTWNRLLSLAVAVVFFCYAAERGVRAYSDQSLKGGLMTATFVAVAIYWVYRGCTGQSDPGREAGG